VTWLPIAGTGLTLLLLGLIVFMARRAGRKSAQYDAVVDALQAAKTRDQVDDQVRRLGPDAVHDELYKDWKRG